MNIKHTNYAEGIHYFDFDEKAGQLGLCEPFFGDVNLKVKMDKSHNQIILDCDINVEAKLLCDRCSEEFETELTKSFKLVYLFGQKPDDTDTPDLYYITPDTDKINLNPDVLDYAILSVPMKNLCRENCQGLCPHCGKNLNEGECDCRNNVINPVWAPLEKLKNNINNK